MKYAVTTEQSHTPLIESPHILLVEDLKITQLGITSTLESWGCTVATATTGQEALEKTGSTFYDLIYLDIHLPDTSGMKLARAIRENPENLNRYTPIIGITATASDKIIDTCLEAGMEAVFHKPLTKDVHTLICERYLGIPLTSIDMNATRQLANNNDELAKDMLELLYLTLQTDVPEIKKAFKNNDGQRFYFLLHRVYGGVLHIGAPELQVACKKLESAYREQNKDVLTCFDNFIRAAERFQNYYNTQNLH